AALRVFPPDGPDAGALLRKGVAHVAVAQAPHLARRGVVAEQQPAVVHHAATQTRADSEADQIPMAARAARLRELLIDPGQKASQRFAVREQVPVVVEKHGNAVPVLEHRPEGDTAAECGQVAQVADHAGGIVGGPGKGERDRRGRLARRPMHGVEARPDLLEACVQVVGAGRKREGLEQQPAAAHRIERELRATRVQREHDAWIVRERAHAAVRRARATRYAKHTAGTAYDVPPRPWSSNSPIARGITAPPAIAMHISPLSSALRSGRRSTVIAKTSGHTLAKPNPQ